MTAPTPFDDTPRDDLFDDGLERLLSGDFSGLDSIDPDLRDTVLKMTSLARTAGWLASGATNDTLLTPSAGSAVSVGEGKHTESYHTALPALNGHVPSRTSNRATGPREVTMRVTAIPAKPPISHRTREHRKPAITGHAPRFLFSGIANAAMVVLMVLAGIGTWRVLDGGIGGGDDPKDSQPTHYAAQPLSGTPVPDTGEYRVGDPGNTNAFPPAVDTSRTYVAEPLGGPQMSAGYGVVVEDTLVFTGRPADAEPGSNPARLYRQDLITGEILWESDVVFDRFTTDGTMVYALTYPVWPPKPNESPIMTAIHLEDGSVLWESRGLAEYADEPRPEAPIFPTEPIAIDGYAYVTLDNGTVLSFNGATGDVAWEYTGSSEPPADGPPVITGLAGDGDHLFALMPDRTIAKLDRTSGELVDTFAFPDSINPAFNIRVHLQGMRLVATADVPRENSGASGFIVVFDTESGEPIWSTELESTPSEVAVAQTMIGVPQTTMTRRPYLIQLLPGVDDYSYDARTLLLDLETGETLVDIESEGGPYGFVTVSASGEVICISDDVVTCVDGTGARTVIDGFQPPEGHALVNPVLYHDGRIVILDFLLPIHIAEPAP